MHGKGRQYAQKEKKSKHFSKKYDDFFKNWEQKGKLHRLISEVMQMSTLLALNMEKGNMQTLTIDEKCGRAFIDGEECALTQQEF